MSSITSVRNSVQPINNQSTGNQVNQTKDAENLHIAEETTNENISENESKSINKYIYPEFEGPAGYDYLLSIAQKVMPYAHWRTWQAADSYQAPGLLCYVSVHKITEKVGPQERKIYLDLQAMQRREWVELERIRMDFMNQEGMIVTRPVTSKDFTGFYRAAHDYHLWSTSREYLAPERENLPLILKDDALVKRLIRFENYRRLIVCAKPGRKSLQEGDYYEEQQRKKQEEILEQKEPISKPKPLSPPKEKGAAAAKREIRANGYTEEELKQDLGKRGAAAVGIPAEHHRKLAGGKDETEEQEQ